MPSWIIVDDSTFVRKSVTKGLQVLGHEVLLDCVEGEEALAQYEDLRPDFVMLDITLPGISGIETLRRLVKQDPSVRVIMCSAVLDKPTQLKCTELGALGFVRKPFNINKPEFRAEFEAKIEGALAERPLTGATSGEPTVAVASEPG